MPNPFAAPPFQSDAAFAGAAERFFDLLKAFAATPTGGIGRTPEWSSLGAQLGRQFEQWLQASAAIGPSLGAVTGFAPPGAPWSFGQVPLGAAAASAGEGENAWELLARLAQLQGQLAAHWSQIAKISAEKFMARARAGEAPAAELTSESALKLYELWVECAEEAYAATVRTDQFCELQAQLTNTGTALLLAQRRQAERLARAWGLPTREEADALQRQIRELREQLAARPPSKASRAAPAGTTPAPKRRAARRARRSRRPRS